MSHSLARDQSEMTHIFFHNMTTFHLPKMIAHLTVMAFESVMENMTGQHGADSALLLQISIP